MEKIKLSHVKCIKLRDPSMTASSHAAVEYEAADCVEVSLLSGIDVKDQQKVVQDPDLYLLQY